MDWICKIERGCEEERMNVVICLMLSTCAFAVLEQSCRYFKLPCCNHAVLRLQPLFVVNVRVIM